MEIQFELNLRKVKFHVEEETFDISFEALLVRNNTLAAYHEIMHEYLIAETKPEYVKSGSRLNLLQKPIDTCVLNGFMCEVDSLYLVGIDYTENSCFDVKITMDGAFEDVFDIDQMLNVTPFSPEHFSLLLEYQNSKTIDTMEISDIGDLL
jgi:hypothetical protein